MSLKEKYDFLMFTDFIVFENEIYISNQSFNALIVYRKDKLAIKEIRSFDGIKAGIQFAHSLCIKCGSKLLFLPNSIKSMKGIHVYNFYTKEINFIRIKNYKLFTDISIDYALIYENKLYALPYKPQINAFSWDMKSDLMKELDWWHFDQDSDVGYLQHGSISECEIYSLYGGTNKLSIADISKKGVRKYSLPDNNVSRISYDGNSFWYILLNAPDIVHWDMERGEIERFRCTEQNEKGMSYLNICAVQESVILISSDGKMLFLLDREKKELIKIADVPTPSRTVYKGNFPHCKIVENSLIIMFEFSSLIMKVDLKSKKVSKYDMALKSDELFSTYLESLLDKISENFIEMENGIKSIEFLLAVCDQAKEHSYNIQDNTGLKIHEIV